MADRVKCSCGNEKWHLEEEHAHCTECQSVVRFGELSSLISYGKRPIDKLLDDKLKQLEEEERKY